MIVYRPGDVSVYCDPIQDPAKPPNLQLASMLYVVLPVKSIWIDVAGFRGDLDDPARKAPSGIPTAMPTCYDDPANRAIVRRDSSPYDLRPCDLHETLLRGIFYSSGWLYNRITVPGVWAGSVSITPVLAAPGSQSLTEDVRFYGSSKAGPGWLGLNATFEKGATASSSLNSLVGAITYDFRLSQRPWWFSPDRSPIDRDGGAHISKGDEGIGIHPGELLLASGEEYAPTRTKGTDGFHEPKDLNIVESVLYRQPISVTALRFPSFITVFPVVGAEGGRHIIRYLSGEPVAFYRTVTGVDASIRYPFQKAPNFTSIKPATIDYSFRQRFLAGNEPYAEVLAGTQTLSPVLSRRRRSYSRIALNWPLSSYVAFTTTVQRGSLPPDFDSVGWTLTLGLSLSSTGTSEH